MTVEGLVMFSVLRLSLSYAGSPRNNQTSLPSALLALSPILVLGFFRCLPLHIRRAIRTASAKGFDVVNNVARAAPFGLSDRGAGVLMHESCPLRGIAVCLGECERRGKCKANN
jgi:hypothetical protein